MMIAVFILVFAAVGLTAAGFVVVPLLGAKNPGSGKWFGGLWLPVGAGLGVMAVGLGVYGNLGQPGIALSSLGGPSPTDYPGLIARMARIMPNRPGDLQGWTMLGEGYFRLGNPAQAEKAFAHAIDIAKAQTGHVPAALMSSYGQALTQENGEITKEAEAAFRAALDDDPQDLISLYFMGYALAARGDKDGALEMWEPLLAEAPPDAPWRGEIIDRVAALKASTGAAAPNPQAMVAQLASRLEGNPNDLDGWVRLIRAYTVLDDADKAKAALTKARSVFANQKEAQAALAQAAKDNGLN